MKFSLTFFATIVVISVLSFNIIPTNACEQSCRTGISKAFGDNYAIEVIALLKPFRANLKNALFNGFSGTPSSSTKSSCNKEIDAQVDKFQKAFIGNFPTLIENSIFNQEPKFKGQCQHPLRVNQPPPGVAWTMEDCQNQDYICGNPPAICHYMDQYVKPRNVKNVIGDLKTRLAVNGSFFSSIVKALTIVGAKSSIKADALPSFVASVVNNIKGQCKDFSDTFANEFCNGETCDKYDHDIKIKLLSYP